MLELTKKQLAVVKRLSLSKIEEGLQTICPGIEGKVVRPPKHTTADFTVINLKGFEYFYKDVDELFKYFSQYWIPISKVETQGIYTNVWYDRTVHTHCITYCLMHK